MSTLPKLPSLSLRSRRRAGLALALLGGALTTGCGSTSTTLELGEMLTVAMIGVFEAPPDAEGNAEPKFVKFDLEGLKLAAADGTEVELFEEEEPLEARIINRSQIIYEASLADYVDTEFTSLTVTFGQDIVAGGKYEDEITAELPVAAAEYVDAITVEKAKGLRLTVQVQWKNILTRDEEADPPTETMTAPTLTLDLKQE
jgi:hypothetical protein